MLLFLLLQTLTSFIAFAGKINILPVIERYKIDDPVRTLFVKPLHEIAAAPLIEIPLEPAIITIIFRENIDKPFDKLCSKKSFLPSCLIELHCRS